MGSSNGVEDNDVIDGDNNTINIYVDSGNSNEHVEDNRSEEINSKTKTNTEIDNSQDNDTDVESSFKSVDKSDNSQNEEMDIKVEDSLNTDDSDSSINTDIYDSLNDNEVTSCDGDDGNNGNGNNGNGNGHDKHNDDEAIIVAPRVEKSVKDLVEASRQKAQSSTVGSIGFNKDN